MALLASIVRNELQTQVNTFAWALEAEKEANHVKLTDYYGIDKEDIYEQCENVARAVDANRWQVVRIYVLVGVYLKGAAADFYKKN